MLSELTEEQKKLMPVIAQKWIDRACKLDETIPNEVYVEQYQKLYKLLGMQEPKVIVTDSPLSAQLVVKTLRLENDFIGESTTYYIGEPVRASVGDSIRASVSDSVWGSVWASVSDSVWDSVWGSVWDSVMDSVGDSVRASVSDSVSDSVRDFELMACYGDVSDYPWVAFHDYFLEIPFKRIPKTFMEYSRIIYSAPSICTLFYDNLVVVAKVPKQVYFDGRNRLHNDEGMAIEFADGWGVYALDGVRLHPKLWEKITRKQITAEEVAKLDNTEQRMLALKYLSPEEFIKGAKAEKVGLPTDRGNTLYKGSFEETGDIYFLRFQCPSTGRDYIEFTNPIEYAEDLKALNGEDISIYNPDALQAYSFVHESSKGKRHLSLADYLKMEVET